jgi:hypothetical protein
VTATLDALVFTERGVYRSGETVFVSALLRDGLGIIRSSALVSASTISATSIKQL